MKHPPLTSKLVVLTSLRACALGASLSVGDHGRWRWQCWRLSAVGTCQASSTSSRWVSAQTLHRFECRNRSLCQHSCWQRVRSSIVAKLWYSPLRRSLCGTIADAWLFIGCCYPTLRTTSDMTTWHPWCQVGTTVPELIWRGIYRGVPR
jgi:hypothetical protein